MTTIAETTIASIQHGRGLLTGFADNLDRMATVYTGLDPAAMTLADATTVFHETASLLRHYRAEALAPLLAMCDSMETACGMAGLIERPRSGLMECSDN